MSLLLEGLRASPEPSAVPEASETPRVRDESGPTEFSRILRGVGTAIDRGEAIMDGAESGAYRSLDPATLIALQAGIYRYSEAVDLMSKLVDRMTSGARTILQSGH